MSKALDILKFGANDINEIHSLFNDIKNIFHHNLINLPSQLNKDVLSDINVDDINQIERSKNCLFFELKEVEQMILNLNTSMSDMADKVDPQHNILF